MRLHHCLALLLSLGLSFSEGAVSLAQVPGDASFFANSGQQGPPPFAGYPQGYPQQGYPQGYPQPMVPPQMQGAQYPSSQQMNPAQAAWGQFHGAAASGSAAMDSMRHAGYPDSMTAWPGSNGPSPYFNNAYSSHYQENGLWHHDSNNRRKKFFFSTEALVTFTKRPQSGIIGSKRAQSYYDLVQEGLEEVDDELYEEFEFSNYYGRQEFTFFDDLESPGLRLRWGYENPDDSGLMITGWWASDNTTSLNGPRDISTRRATEKSLVYELLEEPDFPDTDISPRTVEEVLDANLMNLGGLPINDGSAGGVTIPFDLGYKIEFRSESWGTSLNWMSTPSYKSGSLVIRPIYGIRYIGVQEGFRFVGNDSGLLYDDGDDSDIDPIRDLKLHSLPNGIDDDGDGIIDNAGHVEPIQDQNGGGGGGGGNQDEDVNYVAVVDPFTSFVDNGTMSHIAGPEMGFRYDLGGDHFKLWGMTKVGIMANHEKMSLKGDNIMMATRGDEVALPVTIDNPNPNAFSSSRSHTHVSPMIETSLFAEMTIFDKLPLLRDVHILESAKFRVGYTYLLIGEVARPYNSIKWDGNPQEGMFPSINLSRRQWRTSNWSFAVDWTY